MQCACAVCHLWPATLSHKRHDFLEKVFEHKMHVFHFLCTFCQKISHSKKNSARCDQKCIFVFMQSTRYSCQIVMKLEFFEHSCEKESNINISWKSVHCEPNCSIRTDMTKLRVAFRNFAYAPKKNLSRCSQWRTNSKVPLLHKSTFPYWRSVV